MGRASGTDALCRATPPASQGPRRRISEGWNSFDFLTMYQQIEATPALSRGVMFVRTMNSVFAIGRKR